MQNQKITIYDPCTVQDFIKNNNDLILEKRQKSPCVGLVRLIKDGKVISLEDSPTGWMTNVTVGIGREFVAQRVFNSPSGRVANLAGVGTADVSAFAVSHFGVGSGGSNDTGAGPVVTSPTVSDVQLTTPLQINTPALDYVSPTITQVNAAKPITTDGSIVFQTDVASNNNYSTVLCTCIVAAGEPYSDSAGNVLTTGQAAKIDEAMLFSTSGTTVLPFAHISFMPKYIELEASLTIEWYVIF